MKKYLLALLGLIQAMQILAQPITSGRWETAMYPAGIIKLSWSYPGMLRNEAIGDAVVQQPIQAPALPGMLQNTMPDSARQRLQLRLGNGAAISGIEAFDSGHVRGIRVAMAANSAWFGGGERSLPLNRSGQRITLYNAPHYGYSENQDELNYSVPFVFTTNGYGLLFDNPSKGYIDFGKTTPDVLEAGFVSGALQVYIIPGNTPDEIIRRYASLTGKQPLPPRWALGNFMSRFGYRSQQQAQSIAAQMKKDGFAMDAVIIDVFWFGDSIQYGLGNLDWINKSKWPNPKAMIDGWRKQNINTILVTEPFVLKNTKNFEASQPYLAIDSSGKPHMLTEFYFGYGGMIDMFQPKARDWFWQFYKKQNAIGVAGWWGDLGEPEKHPSVILHNLESFGVKRKMGADEVHNMYGHMWSKMVFENWRKDHPDKRLFFLNRAGYAGSQRFSIFPWTGDISRSWSGFRAQLPLLQSMSMSGIPYIHSDAGGFSMVEQDDPELYIRWLQFAAFTPVFRPHGTAVGDDLKPKNVVDVPSEPALKPEPYKSIARNIVNLRYQLLPYNYTLAYEQTALGKPLIRPMVYYGIKDSALLQANDQYMFGDAFLVAPVTAPGATSRKIYLPEGQWYRLENNTMIPGKQWIDETVSLEQMPVMVKAGSFVSHWDTTAYMNTARYKSTQPLRIRYYPALEHSNALVYDDDGNDPNALEDKNKHQLLELSGHCNAEGISITVTPANWPVGLKRSIMIEIPVTQEGNTILHVQKAATKWLVNDKAVSVSSKAGIWKNTRWITIPVMCTGQTIHIQGSW